jgi:DNA-directed RNA polymerase specialized sigma24 family protein
MANFDRTIDNRWRPELESSQRRVRDEERDAPRMSRELAFVPTRRRRLEPYDRQTVALIRRHRELERLPHGERVRDLLDEWQWTDRMKSPEQKQRFLEPLIEAVRRDPEKNEALLIFLMLAFEPVRRSISREFVALHSGLSPQPRDVNWANRYEARMLHHVEREQLYDVTREAALEAVFRYPSEGVERFFPWLRETIAYRALDRLRGDLPELETTSPIAAEAAALQATLAGLDQFSEPTMRERRGLREWRLRIRMRDVFDVVEEFFAHDPVREACKAAVGRLPRAQKDVIERYFYEEQEVPRIAAARGVATSTIYNQKARAQESLHGDDVFFSALHALHRVRDAARAKRLAEAYPDGKLPDGRRIVVIESGA